MDIDDDLIDNLRITLREYRDGAAGITRLLDAVDEIVNQQDLRNATVIRDTDGDVWHCHEDMHWCFKADCFGAHYHSGPVYLDDLQTYAPLTVVR